MPTLEQPQPPRTTTVEPPLPQAPDAGVIEEARARQRRQRGIAGAVMLAAVAIAVVLFVFAGGGGTSRPAAAPMPGKYPPSKPARPSQASCLSKGRALQGAPSRSLLSILGVLRRPATAADALPQSLAGHGLTRGVFVNYIRRTQVVNGSPYYLYPAIIGGCGVEPEHQGIMDLATHVNIGHGLIGGGGGGGATVSEIERGMSFGSGPPASATSATITMVVPDGVASITLRYPAGRASGYSPKISPPFTITTAPVNNELVVTIPRSSGSSRPRGMRMIWRAANGHTIRTFNRL
ncbi:MAG: hypothetical protein ACRDK7_13065 [Solirubrobacteraceae bacterium]